MKTTLTTTFAFAVMVFAFSADPIAAGGKGVDKYECQGPTDPHCQPDVFTELEGLDGVGKDSDQTDNGREIADSGNEGSTSAASANDQ